MGWLILAAGSSRRFDGDKLLTCIPNTNKTIIEFCIEKFVDLDQPICVVTRMGHSSMHNLLDRLKIDYTICPNSHLGMGESLAWGVQEVASGWAWLAVVLADMPLIENETLYHLSSLATVNNIVVPTLVCENTSYQSWGHPVVFGSNYFQYLRELSGDQGAKKVLQRFSSHIVEHVTKDAGVVRDVDSRLDMKKIAEQLVPSN